MILDFNKLSSTEVYKVVSQTVTPRPIAWIVTKSTQGVINIAPFSYFTPLSSSPAIIVVSIGHKSSKEPKDTLRNILETKKATVCFVNESNLNSAILSSTELEFNKSEATKYSIETKNIIDNFPPLISNSEAGLFCDFHSKIELGGKTIPLILEIKSGFYQDSIIDKNLDINLSNIARVGKEFASLSRIDLDV
jgi:flavin reductase (DIM6/NTAB) family NADH-FMN oxidoreductase RutF